MSDNLHKRGPKDASRVNVHEKWEVEYWTKKFECNETQLLDAVSVVGTNAQAVQQQLIRELG